LGMTIQTYRGFNERLDNIWANQYKVNMSGDFHKDKKVKKDMTKTEDYIKKHVKTDTFKRYTLDTINTELEVNKNGSTLNPSSNQFDGRLFY
ncbi:ABC transporter permease, partial [Staphylococcus warneri]